jgi:16S rRNA (cytosine1402-N4)-methyltransferase
MTFEHLTVLRDETVAALEPSDGQVFVDATLGGGGHTEALLSAAECRVVGIDRDPHALAAASRRLARFGSRFTAVRGSFSGISAHLAGLSLAHVDGVVADLGVSSPQLDTAERGFSFRFAGPLDMRMDPDAALDAATVVNTWAEDELGTAIRDFGEERQWRRVARAIVEGRPWSDTTALADAVRRVVGSREQHRIHPATRTFQAIRIVVNDELGEIQRFLPAALDHLRIGGRLAVISFHSLEDRLVKQFMAYEAAKGAERDPWGNPMRAPRVALRGSQTADGSDNPRARSARLRVAVRLA